MVTDPIEGRCPLNAYHAYHRYTTSEHVDPGPENDREASLEDLLQMVVYILEALPRVQPRAVSITASIPIPIPIPGPGH